MPAIGEFVEPDSTQKARVGITLSNTPAGDYGVLWDIAEKRIAVSRLVVPAIVCWTHYRELLADKDNLLSAILTDAGAIIAWPVVLVGSYAYNINTVSSAIKKRGLIAYGQAAYYQDKSNKNATIY
jgi:hypothetical protein